MTRFRWGVATDVGRVRNVNQDSYLAVEGVFVVADGMGGHRGGEVASSVAVDALAGALPVLSSDELLGAIQESNREVYWRAADDPALRGMGTTMCVLALVPDGDQPTLLVANVGDSRIYRLAAGALEQMTDDHSMVAELERQGRITPAEAATHPQRNILTRALGIEPAVSVDAWQVAPEVGARWLLCSDGLFNEVPEATIAAVLGTTDDPSVAAEELVRLANEGGGRDNTTVVVVDVLADDDQHAAPVSMTPDVVVHTDPTPVAGPFVEPEVVTAAAPGPAGTAPRRRARRARLAALLVALVLAGAAGVLLLVDQGDDPADPPPGPAVTTPAVTTPSTTTATSTTTTTVTTTASTTTAAPVPTSATVATTSG